MHQFQYIKIQRKTIDLKTGLQGITAEFVGFISLVLRSIVLDLILIYRNCSISLLSHTIFILHLLLTNVFN